MANEISFHGIAASPGLARGPAFIWREKEVVIPRETGRVADQEYQRLGPVLQQARGELDALRQDLVNAGLKEEAQVFHAHVLILDDPTLHGLVRSNLETGINLEAAWLDAVNMLAGQLAAIPDPTISGRAADLRDAGKRVLCLLLGAAAPDGNQLTVPSIVLAKDLCPSETATMDKNKVLGFCTVEGGATSHTAILARSLGIPAVVGISGGLLDIPAQAEVILDGTAGTLLASPNAESLSRHEIKKSAWMLQTALERNGSQEPAVTLDGHRFEVVANVGNLDDAIRALECGAEGIGLLRTEFLFIDRMSAPSEAEQYQAYASILNVMEHRPVIVRTIDVGGDKSIPYLDLGREANPFLGYRAIRMCLEEVDFFKTQLRALLRSGFGHDLRIMFPMISSVDEVLQARSILDEVKAELAGQGAQIAEKPQIGIMVEIPSAAVLADKFAEVVDFFSIGTNDLTQYTLAVDRTNPRIARLGDHCHPAVVRQIQHVIEAAHRAGIWVGVCGEMAGDPDAIPILLGLGLDEFSMAGSSIPRAKTIIRSINLSDARKLAHAVLDLRSAEQVRIASKTMFAPAGSL